MAGLDPDGNMERAGMRLGGAANGTRGAEAAKMFAEVQKMKRVRACQNSHKQVLRTYPSTSGST